MGQMELLLNVYASQKVHTASTCIQDAGLRIRHAATRTHCVPCCRADVGCVLALCLLSWP